MTDKQDKDDFLEPFRIALQLEKEGKQFFLDAAGRTTSSLARHTFEFLAGEEDKHIEVIKRFHTAMADSDGHEPIDVGDSDAEERLESFHRRLEEMREEYQTVESDREAYRMALDFENGAEDFYERMREEATDPRIKKFYSWLITEESMHSRLINSCLKFVEDPVEWFRRRKR